MGYPQRKLNYKKIEKARNTKVFAFVTSDRSGMETNIAQDCIDLFVNLLDEIGPTKKISLLLHTNGGSTLAAWRLINLIRTFCDQFEVLIPLKAMSAGTLIALGSDKIVMTKQAALGPIDPSITGPLNPQVNLGGLQRHVPVSVEAVRGYLEAARDLGIKNEGHLTSIFLNLSQHIHPLVLGDIFRSRTQIRFLADKLIKGQVKDSVKRKKIIDFLSVDSGSHDYTMNRREALELGLSVEKPTEPLYQILRKIHTDFVEELKLLEPYSQALVLGSAPPGQPVAYRETRGLIESVDGGCYAFVSEGELERVQAVGPMNLPQFGKKDDRTFEGWKKLH